MPVGPLRVHIGRFLHQKQVLNTAVRTGYGRHTFSSLFRLPAILVNLIAASAHCLEVRFAGLIHRVLPKKQTSKPV